MGLAHGYIYHGPLIWSCHNHVLAFSMYIYIHPVYVYDTPNSSTCHLGHVIQRHALFVINVEELGIYIVDWVIYCKGNLV